MADKSVLISSSFTGEPFQSIDVDVSDSDSWEVIDPSDSDSDDGDFFYGDVTTTDDEKIESDIDDLVQHQYGSPSSDISMQSLVDEIKHHSQELIYEHKIDHSHQIVDQDAVVKDGYLIGSEDNPYREEVDESVEDDDDVDSDLDDELVPKWLNNKFERQRMRKLGKRVYPKMKKSKRLVNQYNKPGCVHGKHGLGMKHNLI